MYCSDVPSVTMAGDNESWMEFAVTKRDDLTSTMLNYAPSLMTPMTQGQQIINLSLALEDPFQMHFSSG